MVHTAVQQSASALALPMTVDECKQRGWSEVDVVFVTGDAYIDHPSFAMAILGRALEDAGFRVAILSQPDWRNADDFRRFGKPRLFFAVSAGNMDSMINHYTANKKVRNDDAYSPGGRIGLRPDRATLAYCQRAREAYPGAPIIAGGVEASLRRLAHYDYWSDTVRKSIVLDAKCDLLVFGMGEEAIVEIARRIKGGHSVKDLRDMRGVTFAMGEKETTPSDDVIRLPSYEEVAADKTAFARASGMFHKETNPYNARTLIQMHGKRAVVQNPPRFPVSTQYMDYLYGLPYTRRPHPRYKEPVPAHEMIKDSVTIMRGCFGGCTFCSITAHQGRIIQSRSQESVLRELKTMAKDRDFHGTVSDIGGPTANMYRMRCTNHEVEKICRRPSCVHPTICKLLGTDHNPVIQLMKESRNIDGIKKVLVSSGIRMDLANRSSEYIRELAAHHVGGRLKVAPEHVSDGVLHTMKKPPVRGFDRFARSFEQASSAACKTGQSLVPYFIASHPGSGLAEMIELAEYLRDHGYKPDQVQDFIPAPMDVATTMYYTGIDPQSMRPVQSAKTMSERYMQRALLQYWKPENYYTVRKALRMAGREDLIGEGSRCLIPSMPPRGALKHKGAADDFVHRIPSSANSPRRGYRPGRKTHQKRTKTDRQN